MSAQTPDDLAGILTLGVLATACATTVEVEVRPGYREPLNLFAVVALPPANRKSVVFSAVTAPLSTHERELAERPTPEIAEALARRRSHELRLQELQRRAAKATRTTEREALERQVDDAARKLPRLNRPPTRLVASDVTPEKLGALRAENGGRIAVISPEGEVFDLMGGRHAKDGKANFDVYLKGHAGDDLRIDRAGREPLFVPRPALTMVLAVQPHVIQRLGEQESFAGRGLLARFLYAVPARLVGRRWSDPPAVPTAIGKEFDRQVRRLLRLEPATINEALGRPHRRQLAPGAYATWLRFDEHLEPRLAETGDLCAIAEWAGKLSVAVARLAGLSHETP